LASVLPAITQLGRTMLGDPVGWCVLVCFKKVSHV